MASAVLFHTFSADQEGDDTVFRMGTTIATMVRHESSWFIIYKQHGDHMGRCCGELTLPAELGAPSSWVSSKDSWSSQAAVKVSG